MSFAGIHLRAVFSRRTASLVACAALLCFALGGAVFHEHSNGPDTACHLCQALHMPALAAARLALSHTPVIIASLGIFSRGLLVRNNHVCSRAQLRWPIYWHHYRLLPVRLV